MCLQMEDHRICLGLCLSHWIELIRYSETPCLISSSEVNELELQYNAKVWSFYLHLSKRCETFPSCTSTLLWVQHSYLLRSYCWSQQPVWEQQRWGPGPDSSSGRAEAQLQTVHKGRWPWTEAGGGSKNEELYAHMCVYLRSSGSGILGLTESENNSSFYSVTSHHSTELRVGYLLCPSII